MGGIGSIAEIERIHDREDDIVPGNARNRAAGIRDLVEDRTEFGNVALLRHVRKLAEVDGRYKYRNEGNSDGSGVAAVDFGWQASQAMTGPQYYTRPSYNGNLRGFTDLVSYAPGMSSNLADVKAVIDAEAAPRSGTRIGTIDPKARKMIDGARSTAWLEHPFHPALSSQSRRP